MEKKREKIKTKVKALLAKTTENGATEAEALAALQKAQELMLEFVIAEHEVLNNPYLTEKCIMKEVDLIKSGYNLRLFYNSLSRLFDCEHFYTKRKISFFGFEEDTELCAYFYNFIIQACFSEKDKYIKSKEYKAMSLLYHGRTLVSSFIKGFMIGICRKMQDMYECRKKGVSNEVGLMIIDKNEKVKHQFGELDFKIRTVKTKELKYETEAFLSGVEKGENVSIVQGINQSKKESTLAIA